MTRRAAALMFAMFAWEARPAGGQNGAAPVSGAGLQPESPRRSAPAWLRISGELRSRLEAPTALDFTARKNDFDLLTRIRIALRLNAGRRLRLAAEWQDARGFGYSPKAPASVANRLDLRLAWLEAGATEGPGWSLRAGRQALKFGKGRLLWDPDWSNTGRAFDALRVGVAGRRLRLDAFAGSVVVPRDGRFDRRDPNQLLYGLYGAATARGGFLLEPYLIVKRHARVRNELGRAGALVLYTSGARAAGRSGRWLEWELEAALQRGTAAGGPVEAWGTVGQVSWPAGPAAGPLRWTVGYTYGSGDADPADGRKGTFDTLYPTTHLRNGATDRIGWANIHDWTLQAEWRRSRRLRFSWSAHDFWLATLRDALYSPGGAPLIRNPLAASRHVGWELAASADYQIHSGVALGAGCAHLFPGPFLRLSRRSGATQPYVFLSYRF